MTAAMVYFVNFLRNSALCSQSYNHRPLLRVTMATHRCPHLNNLTEGIVTGGVRRHGCPDTRGDGRLVTCSAVWVAQDNLHNKAWQSSSLLERRYDAALRFQEGKELKPHYLPGAYVIISATTTCKTYIWTFATERNIELISTEQF
jgi:hypothetical protein